jgi:hypothetical protein
LLIRSPALSLSDGDWSRRRLPVNDGFSSALKERIHRESKSYDSLR